MNKELEALEIFCRERTQGELIDGFPTGNIYVGMTKEEFEVVEQALLELKAIKEAKSSETLRKLRELRAKPFNWETLIKVLDEVEQALLKSQETKQYLKWEDLKNETDCLRVDLNVSLNGTKYRLSYFPDNPLKLLTNDEDFYLEIENKQFFNSLHLERVKENE